MFTRTFLVLGCVLSIMGNTAEAVEGQVTALFGKSTTEKIGFYIYSKKALKNPSYWEQEKWHSFESLGEAGGNHIYYFPASEAPTAGQIFFVSGGLPDGSRFTDQLKAGDTPREDGSIVFAVSTRHLVNVPAKTTQVVSSAPAVNTSAPDSSWEGQFMTLLNAYRTQNGRQPIVWDQRAADVARANNYGGGGHNRQFGFDNWAGSPSSPQDAFDRWKRSPGHNANMLNPSLRRGGCHFIPGRHGTLCMSW